MKIEFSTSGAAFCDPFEGNEDAGYKAVEIRHIFKTIEDEVFFGKTSGVIMDTNGNKVGSWSID